MQKKYQIFVSSTFKDLAEERQDAIRNILDLGHIPAGMELFPAADSEQLDYIKKVIDECDYYVLIMGGRYGSLDPEGVSYTEREYDYAVATGMTVLAFPHGDPPSLPVAKSDTGDRMKQNLEEFREKVMDGRLVRQWTDRQELQLNVIKALNKAFTDAPAVGWIRGSAVATEDLLQRSATLQTQLSKLQEENEKLRSEIRPAMHNLASGNERVTLNFSRQKGRQGAYYTQRATEEMTWDEIFKAVAIGLDGMARVSSLISSYISKYIEEVRQKEVKFLNDEDAAIVKNQLQALGLIKLNTSKSTDGRFYEFMSLSLQGKKKFSEMIAIKSHSDGLAP